MNKKITDATVIEFSNGDIAAFEAIRNLFYDQIKAFSKRLTGNKQESEEITSTTFMKLYKLHANFKTVANVKSFLYITARNSSLDYRRSVQTRSRHISPLAIENEELVDNGKIGSDNTEDVWQGADEIVEVKKAVALLPERCRQICLALFYDDKSTSEIAKAMGITEETVRSQKRRAVALLRDKLSSNPLLPYYAEKLTDDTTDQ